MSLFPNQTQTQTLASVPSSRGLGFYDIKLGRDDVFYCSCPGWMHSKKRPKMCRHLASWVVGNLGEVFDLMEQRHGKDKGDKRSDALVNSANGYDGKRK